MVRKVDPPLVGATAGKGWGAKAGDGGSGGMAEVGKGSGSGEASNGTASGADTVKGVSGEAGGGASVAVS